MDLVRVIAGLTFLVVVTTIIGIWLTSEKRRSIRERLGYRGRVTPKADTQLLRAGTFEATTASSMAGISLPVHAVREYISSALDMVIHLARLSDGTRSLGYPTPWGRA